MGTAAASGLLLPNVPPSRAATVGRKTSLNAPTASHAIAEPAALAQNPLALVYDREYLLYQGPRVGTFGEGPTRLQAIVERLQSLGLQLETHPVGEATLEQLRRVHTPSYVRYIQKEKKKNRTCRC